MDNTNLPEEFLALLKCFVAEEIEFLVVGGWAVISHGYVRYTQDLDIWIASNPGNAAATLRALDLLDYQVKLEYLPPAP